MRTTRCTPCAFPAIDAEQRRFTLRVVSPLGRVAHRVWGGAMTDPVPQPPRLLRMGPRAVPTIALTVLGACAATIVASRHWLVVDFDVEIDGLGSRVDGGGIDAHTEFGLINGQHAPLGGADLGG